MRDIDRPGFDTVPQRNVLLTMALFAVVVTVSTAIAVGYKESALWVVHRIGGFRDPTRAAAHLPFAATALIVAVVGVVAAWMARAAASRWPGRSGLEAIAASARGEERRISLRATLVRSGAVWLTVAGMLPIGRESAILETGGAIGTSVARRFRGHGATMATAGIAAAFATAYHAPIAAVLYLDEHLRIRGSRRALTFSAGGAVGGDLLATRVFGSRPVLPAVHTVWRQLAVAGVLVLVPAVVASRLFLEARTRAGRRRRDTTTRAWWARCVLGSLATGLLVAWLPSIAGNGMDALRRIPAAGVGLGVAFAIAVSLGKGAGASTSFAAGTPGGALTPTMTVAAGAALLALHVARAVGASPYVWGGVVLAAAAAIAIGLRSPLAAVALLPEMTGHLSLLPATIVMVLAAIAADRLFTLVLRKARRAAVALLPQPLSDEDG